MLRFSMVAVSSPILASATEAGHSVGWIADFGLVLAAAGLAAMLFRILQWPLIFGYLLAGIIIGPHVLPIPLVEDRQAIQSISELGVIFLLFFIGLEFDLKRLQRVLGPALIGLLLQTFTMLYLARLLGPALGWNAVNTLFFGSLLAISSSMVTVRVLRDSNRLREAPSQFTIGILILEDVLAVILLVVLTGVALTRTFAWDAVGLVVVAMLLFIVVVFLIGRTFVPWLYSRICGQNPDPEVMTLMSVGLVMAVSLLALKLEFSPALGAFVAGTLFSSTAVARQVETMNRSLHDVFTAVFFVAVGMQLDPALLFDEAGWILLVAVLVIVGKTISCSTGLVLSGQRGQTAFKAAVPKAQIGEFSFIIAALGNNLGVLDPQLTSIAYGVALLTILATPPLTARTEEIHGFCRRALPNGILGFLQTYRQFIEGLAVGLGRSVVLRLIRRPLLQVVLYFLLITGLVIVESVASRHLFPLFQEAPFPYLWKPLYWLLAGLLLAPFLFAVLRNLNAIAFVLTDALISREGRTPYYLPNLKQMISGLILGLFTVFLALMFLVLAAPYLPEQALPGLLGLIVLLAIVFFRGRLIRVNSQMELLFINTFREDVSTREEGRRQEILSMIKDQTPWDVAVEDIMLPRRSTYSGSLIRDLGWRSNYGVNILALCRYNSVVFDPAPGAPVFSGDRIIVSGKPESITAVREAAHQQLAAEDRPSPGKRHFRLQQIFVPPRSELDGQTLAGAHVRQRFRVTVIGIQQEEKRILNPSPDHLIHAGDVLLIAGLPERIEAFARHCGEKPLPAQCPLP